MLDCMELTRLNVNLNHETAQALAAIASDNNISLTEATRRAIALLKFIEDEIGNDRKVQIMDRSGRNKRELVLM